jgi:hypothetical protein
MATTVNGLPVPDDTDPVAQGAANMRAMAGKLQCVAAGQVTAVLTNTVAANVAMTFPAGRFTTAPTLTVSSWAASTYIAYTVSVTAAGGQVGARQYKDVAATTNIAINWTAVGS